MGRSGAAATPLLAALAGCAAVVDVATPDPGSAEVDGPEALWVLVHPDFDAPAAPGLQRVALATGEVLAEVSLPNPLGEPHGLAAIDDRLVVGDLLDASLYVLDLDGGVIDAFRGFPTAGVVGWGEDELWLAAQYGTVQRVSAALTVLESARFSGRVEDLATDGDHLYLLEDGDHDRVHRWDGAVWELVSTPATYSNRASAMTWWGDHLLVVDDPGDDTNVLRHIDPVTGAWLGYTPLPVEGWVTAIAVPSPPVPSSP